MKTPIMAGFVLAVALAGPVQAHDFYPRECCSNRDCVPIEIEDVDITEGGFFIKASGETIPYADPRIRQTPPEGGAHYHRCAHYGDMKEPTICLFIPNWTG
jgi:hypothetical protein